MLADSFTKIGKFYGSIRNHRDVNNEIMSRPIQVSVALEDNSDETYSISTSLGELIDNVISKACIQLGISLEQKPILMDNDNDNKELPLGKTLMHCNIRDGAKLQLKKTSSTEILTFIYNENDGLGTTHSPFTSNNMSASHSTNKPNKQETTQNTVFVERVMNRDMYRNERIENVEVESLENGQIYNITTKKTLIYESTNSERPGSVVLENKKSEGGGVKIKEDAYGTLQSEFIVTNG